MSISVILALIIGVIFGEIEWLKYPLKELGGIFVALLKMAVIPIAFVSIAKAILEIGNSGKLSKVSAKAFLLAIGMSIVAVIFGLVLMSVIGTPLIDVGQSAIKEVKTPLALEFIKNCIPSNPFKSFADGNMLQIITLAIFTGIASLKMEDKGKIVSALTIIQNICFKFAEYAMKFAPIGVFALLYPVVAKSFSNVIQGYLIIAGTLVIGSVLYTALFSVPLMYLFKVDGIKMFMTVIGEDIIYAISGGASSSLAPRMEYLKNNTDISHEIIDYLSPLLSVLMRVGSCICVGIYTIYVANMYGIDLNVWQIVTVILLTVVALTCAPGIIGGTLMDCAIIWAAVGIPLEAVALLVGIDYIMDLIRTVLNIQGGEIVTACIKE